MDAFLVPRPEQDIHESTIALPLEPNMEEQEPSSYYAGLMQCIDRVTKPYRDTISRQVSRRLFYLIRFFFVRSSNT